MEPDFLKSIRRALHLGILALSLMVVAYTLLGYYLIDPSLSFFDTKEEVIVVVDDPDRIENGIHLRTGLIEAEGLMTVVNNCTNCHSSKLVIQNRMNTERWNATIKWMQETQNLWSLGDNQEIIVNYLVSNYPPKKKGRRENLADIEWYELED